MIKNLYDYFLPEQIFYLNKMAYERIENVSSENEYSLNCSDNISVELNVADEVKVVVTRKLFFEPEQVFSLSVSFGADLKLNPSKKDEYDWSNINLAEEFRNYGDFVTNNLMSRISLMIAQITSSFGQQPLILSPVVSKNEGQSGT